MLLPVIGTSPPGAWLKESPSRGEAPGPDRSSRIRDYALVQCVFVSSFRHAIVAGSMCWTWRWSCTRSARSATASIIFMPMGHSTSFVVNASRIEAPLGEKGRPFTMEAAGWLAGRSLWLAEADRKAVNDNVTSGRTPSAASGHAGGRARKLRIQYPGATFHVMNRGDRQEPILGDDRDRERFLERLAELRRVERRRGPERAGVDRRCSDGEAHRGFEQAQADPA